MSNRSLNVFVSSTSLDLKAERAAVRDVTIKLEGLRFLGMEYFGSRDENTERASLAEIDHADLYVGVIGERYGSGITEMEYSRAQERGIPCFIYLKSDCGTAAESTESLDSERRLEALRARLRRGHTCSEFVSPNELAWKLSTDLHNWLLEKYLARGLARLSMDYVSRIQGFVAEYVGEPRRPVPFGGRAAELALLTQWLEDAAAPHYLLIAAGAGRGKSALLVRWTQQLLNQEALVPLFFPVSIRFRTNLASVAFPSLTAYLAALHNEPLSVTPNTPAEVWRGLMTDYLARPLPNGRRLVLILDGLDEAADWDAGPDLFPPQLSRHARVVVSARLLAGDLDAGDWLRRLGWDAPQAARTMTLSPLSQFGVADVLEQMGFPLAELGERDDIVRELHRLSEGDPLLVRLYVDDLWSRGDTSARLHVQDLRAIRPGLDGFFARWWDDQRQLWKDSRPLQERRVQTVMNFLACALGPLSRDDLLSLASPVAELSSWTLAETLEPLRRFVVGDGVQSGFVYSHPRLGIHFRERLASAERDTIEAAVQRWCTNSLRTLEAGKSSAQGLSPYIVQYFGAHLDRSVDEVERYALLLTDSWRQAWLAFEGAYAGYRADLRRAQRAIAHAHEVALAGGFSLDHLALEVRAALCTASVGDLLENTPSGLVAALVEKGVWSRNGAAGYARLIRNAERRARVLIFLASSSPEPVKSSIFKEVFEAIALVDRDDIKAALLGAASSGIPATHVTEALDLALALRHRGAMINALLCLAPRLSLSQAEAVIAIAGSIDDAELRARLLCGIAAAQPEGLIQILTSAGIELEPWEHAWMLVGKAETMPGELCEPFVARALALIEGVDDLSARLELKLAIARLDGSGRLLHEIREELDRLNYFQQSRAAMLCKLCALFPQNDRSGVLSDALKAIAQIQAEAWRAVRIVELAPSLDTTHAAEALSLAARIQDEGSRGKALAGLIPYLPEILLQEGVALLLAIADPFVRVTATAPIARFLPKEVCDELAVSMDEQCLSPSLVLELLSALAPWLSQRTLAHLLESSRADHYLMVLAVCAALVPHLCTPLQASASSYLSDALEAGLECNETDEEAFQFLGIWAQCADDSSLDKVLSRVAEWKERKTRFGAIEAVAPHLSASLLDRALRRVQTIADSGVRNRAQVACFGMLAHDVVLTRLRSAWTGLHATDRVSLMLGWLPNSGAGADALRAEIVRALQEIDNDQVCAEAISTFIKLVSPSLKDHELVSLIQVALRFQVEARPNTLAKLYPHLQEDLLARHFTQLFDAALDRTPEAIALAAKLARRATDDVFDKAFKSAVDVECARYKSGEASYRLFGLIGVAEELAETHRSAVADHLWKALGAMPEVNQVQLLADIGKGFPGAAVFPRCLALVRAIDDRTIRRAAALVLLKWLDEPFVSALMTELIGWMRDFARANLSSTLMKHLEGAASAAAEAGAWQTTVVLHCLPRLGRDSAVNWVRLAYAEIRSVGRDELTAKISGVLLPAAPEELREELARHAVESLRLQKNKITRLVQLGELLAFLPVSALPLAIREAIELVRALHQIGPGELELEALVPALLVELLPKITPDQARVVWLAAFENPQLLARVLHAFLEHMPRESLIIANAELLQAIGTLNNALDQDECLKALASALAGSADTQLLHDIEKAVDPAFGAVAAAHALPYVTADLTEHFRTHALRSVIRLQPPGVRLEIIGRMLHATAGEYWPQLCSLAVETLGHLSSIGKLVRGGCAVIPHLSGTSRAQATALVLDGIDSTKPEAVQAAKLVEFSPAVSDELADDAIKIVSRMHDRKCAAYAAEALLKNVPDRCCPALIRIIRESGHWIDATNMLEAIEARGTDRDVARATIEALGAVVINLSIEAELPRAQSLTPRLVQLWTRTGMPESSRSWYSYWHYVVAQASHRSRAELMETLCETLPIIDKLGPSGTIEQIAESLHEVGQWWP